MDDLISRKDLMKKIAHHTVHDSMSYVTFERSTVYEMVKGDMFGLVKDAPAVAAIPRWISVEDRMPEYDTMVLVYVTNRSGWYSIETDMFYSGGWLNSPDDEWHSITHWMFLPEPPKEE